MTDKATGPLRGLKIVDISTVVAGPSPPGCWATDGAEVIKVEMPGAGDSLRAAGAAQGRHAAVVEGHQPQQARRHARPAPARRPDLFAKLIADADVLVENFRPGTLDSWGLTRAWLQEINPRLTILRVTGFGQDRSLCRAGPASRASSRR